ncbi:MAG: glutamate-5-semialdehyde dehydrogenase [Coriobacteriaceae bacterium]|nr:glutamate-5-semialdehyde dehydrogenase [Coriobacteriaceae bacterium]
MDINHYVAECARKAKEASRSLGFASDEARCAAVRSMAAALRERAGEVLAANERDMDAARSAGTSEGLLDRLLLTPERIESMAAGLEKLADLPDPVGRVLEERTIDQGVNLRRVSVPLGLVAMVYEARPNVTADAAGICVRTGNACILRGGSLAQESCVAIARILADAVEASGFAREAVSIIETTDRAATAALMAQRGVVDVLIPRGGAGLIQRCVRESLVPVIETGTGNCHTYVHESADLAKALAIIMNAKTQRVGVCNACESILVDEAVADKLLPVLLAALAGAGVAIHADERVCGAANRLAAEGRLDAGLARECVKNATEEDWGREYLALEVSVKCVSGLDEAIAHVNRYGTGHSECIVAEDPTACDRFLREVDAAAVYANASTRFTDGGEFGLGAEIGISTQKLHARGPFAAEALTTYKYELRGCGQVRP